jgi:hypothetical protein
MVRPGFPDLEHGLFASPFRTLGVALYGPALPHAALKIQQRG